MDVKKRMFKFKLLMVLSYFNLDAILQKIIKKEAKTIETCIQKDIQLHGACLVFTEQYINDYMGLYDKTFMYGEESILKYIAERDFLSMVYLDKIEVYHKEGSSTNAIYGKGIKKRRFYYKWNIHGCKELVNLMK